MTRTRQYEKLVHVRLTPEMFDVINRLAKQDQRDVCAMIRKLLYDRLAELEREA